MFGDPTVVIFIFGSCQPSAGWMATFFGEIHLIHVLSSSLGPVVQKTVSLKSLVRPQLVYYVMTLINTFAGICNIIDNVCDNSVNFH